MYRQSGLKEVSTSGFVLHRGLTYVFVYTSKSTEAHSDYNLSKH